MYCSFEEIDQLLVMVIITGSLSFKPLFTNTSNVKILHLVCPQIYIASFKNKGSCSHHKFHSVEGWLIQTV